MTGHRSIGGVCAVSPVGSSHSTFFQGDFQLGHVHSVNELCLPMKEREFLRRQAVSGGALGINL
jgi:hypothetical protein